MYAGTYMRNKQKKNKIKNNITQKSNVNEIVPVNIIR